MSSNTKAFEDKMKSAVEHLERELKTVRAGRANPGVLDKVTVDYYGSPTPIQQVASVAVREADPADRRRTLLRCTEKAQPIIVRGRALQEEFGQKLLENTTEAQRKAFCETMDIMNKNLDAILERDT